MYGDVVYLVRAGIFVISTPEAGEVYRVLPGDAVCHGSGAWNHGISHRTDALWGLELITLPPKHWARVDEASQFDRPAYVQDHLIGHWPSAVDEAHSAATVRMLRPADVSGAWRAGRMCSSESGYRPRT